jgi:flagellar M-ring protein FliF
VERSVQSVRNNEASSQRQTASPTSVEQNLPETQAVSSDGPQSSSQNDRREEITNYEINSRRVATISNGYTVDRMSVAVVVNQHRLLSILGENATPQQFEERVAEIRKVVASATGFDEKRGDVIDVSAVEFIDGLDGEALPQPGVMDAMGKYTGTLINATAFVAVAFLVAFFGLRPMAAALTAKPATALAAPSFEDVQRSLPTPDMAAGAEEPPALTNMGATSPAPIDDISRRLRPAPQERLARMVDLNEERTAQILRKWAAAEAASTVSEAAA